MKIVKRILVFLVVVVVLAAAGSYFVSPKVHVERSQTIQAPTARVFEQVNTLKNWEKWSPWHKLDPNMKLQYSGPPSGKGASYSWQSDKRNVGNGTLTITKSLVNSRIDMTMHFSDGDAEGSFRFQDRDTRTQVIWTMDADMGRNPIARYMGLMMDKMVGPEFEKGLNNLKMVCETK